MVLRRVPSARNVAVRLPVLAVLLISSLPFAKPAHADIINVSVTGIVRSYLTTAAVDGAGVFGPRGASLVGDAFGVVWTIDTGCSCAFVAENYVAGGSVYGTASPVIDAVLTIAGHSVSFGSGEYGVLQGYNFGSGGGNYTSGTYQNVTVQPGNIALNTYIDSRTANIPASITQPFSYVFDPLTDNLETGGVGGGFLLGATQGYFTVTNVALTNSAVAVPAPTVGSGAMSLLALLFILYGHFRRARSGAIKLQSC